MSGQERPLSSGLYIFYQKLVKGRGAAEEHSAINSLLAGNK